MKQFRSVPETDLIIVSGLVEPAVARDFQAEWTNQLIGEQRAALTSTPKKFFDQDSTIGHILDRPDLPATHLILRLLELVSKDDVAIGLNFQSPLGAQRFHQDNATRDGVVYVVHGADGGAFDYAPEARSEQEAEASFLSTEVSAGDVLLQTQQRLFHRGRNPSSLPRVTVALARVDSDVFYDSYR